MTFDPHKPVMTRDGRKARIICTSVKGTQTIAAAIDNGSYETVDKFFPNGKWNGVDDLKTDLINVPEMKSWWYGVYRGGAIGQGYSERALLVMDCYTSILEIRMCDGKLVDCIQHEIEK